MANMLYWRFSRGLYTNLGIRLVGYRPVPAIVRDLHDQDDVKKRMERLLRKNNTSDTTANSGQKKGTPDVSKCPTEKEISALKAYQDMYREMFEAKRNENSKDVGSSTKISSSPAKEKSEGSSDTFQKAPVKSQDKADEPVEAESPELTVENRVKAFVALKEVEKSDLKFKPDQAKTTKNDAKSSEDQALKDKSPASSDAKVSVKSTPDKKTSGDESSHNLKFTTSSDAKVSVKAPSTSDEKNQEANTAKAFDLPTAKAATTAPSQASKTLPQTVSSQNISPTTQLNSEPEKQPRSDQSDHNESNSTKVGPQMPWAGMFASLYKSGPKAEKEKISKALGTHQEKPKEEKEVFVVRRKRNSMDVNKGLSDTKSFWKHSKSKPVTDKSEVKIDSSSCGTERTDVAMDGLVIRPSTKVEERLSNAKPFQNYSSSKGPTTKTDPAPKIESINNNNGTKVVSDWIKSSSDIRSLNSSDKPFSSDAIKTEAIGSVAEEALKVAQSRMQKALNPDGISTECKISRSSLLKSCVESAVAYDKKSEVFRAVRPPFRFEYPKNISPPAPLRGTIATLYEAGYKLPSKQEFNTPTSSSSGAVKSATTVNKSIGLKPTATKAGPVVQNVLQSHISDKTSSLKPAELKTLGQGNVITDFQVTSTTMGSSGDKKSLTSYGKTEKFGTDEIKIGSKFVDKNSNFTASPVDNPFEVTYKSTEMAIKSEGDLTPGDLYNSYSEGEDRTASDLHKNTILSPGSKTLNVKGISTENKIKSEGESQISKGKKQAISKILKRISQATEQLETQEKFELGPAEKSTVIKERAESEVKSQGGSTNFNRMDKDHSASNILKRISQEAESLKTKEDAIHSPEDKDFVNQEMAGEKEIKLQGDLTPGDLYNSKSEGEDSTTRESPSLRSEKEQMIEENANLIEMKKKIREHKKRRSAKKHEKRASDDDAIKRNRVQHTPRTLTEYLYEILKGRRSITTYSAASSRSPGPGGRRTNRTNRNRSPRQKPSQEDVYIAPDLHKRGLGAEVIRKERRDKANQDKNTGSQLLFDELRSEDLFTPQSIILPNISVSARAEDHLVNSSRDDSHTKIRGGTQQECKDKSLRAQLKKKHQGADIEIKGGSKKCLEQTKELEKNNDCEKQSFSNLTRQLCQNLCEC